MLQTHLPLDQRILSTVIYMYDNFVIKYMSEHFPYID